MESFSVYGIVVSYVCLLFALCVHEAAHALVAEWRGDDTPRLMGRVTLNPLPHIDPIGTVLMPLLMMFWSTGLLFGWARPVAYNPTRLKDIRRDPVLIALAGPLSNLALALVAAVGLRLAVSFLAPGSAMFGPVIDVLDMLIKVNLILMLFNAIPLPPLDGHYVLRYFLPPGGQRILESIGPFGILIAILIGSRFLLIPYAALYNAVTNLALWGH